MNRKVLIIAVMVLVLGLLVPAAYAQYSKYGSSIYSEVASRVGQTVHATTTDPVNGFGQDNKFCPACGGNAKENWYACGRCHVGGHPGGDATREPVLMYEKGTHNSGAWINVDCAVCHDPAYDFSKRTYNATLGKWDYTQASSGQRVWSISSSATMKVNACYRCHYIGLDRKRGTPYKADKDVHAAAGKGCLDCHPMAVEKVRNDCTSCHNKINHKFSRGIQHADLSANDNQNTDVACTMCHTWSKHPIPAGGDKSFTTNHGRLECQSCHTPLVEGLVYRYFRNPGINVNDVFDVLTSGLKAYQSFTFTDETGATQTVTPYLLKWWDGAKDPEQHPIFTTRSNSKAKLVPVKEIKTKNAKGTGEIMYYHVQLSHGIKPKTQAKTCTECHNDPVVKQALGL